MLLIDYCERYIQYRGASEGHAYQLRSAVRCLQVERGAEYHVQDLTEDVINSHLTECRRRGLSDSTIQSRKTNLVVLWRAAAKDRRLDDRPDIPDRYYLQPTPIRDYTPRGWTAADIARLIETSAVMDGEYQTEGGPIPRRDYWVAYWRAAWDSGLAPCDMLAMRLGSIGDDGTVQTVRIKTGKAVRYQLRPATLAAIGATCPPSRELAFPRWLFRGRVITMRAFGMAARSVIDAAGVNGSLKWSRSGAGTAVDEIQPGAGPRLLGNTARVFSIHYDVQEHRRHSIPLPPDPDEYLQTMEA